MNDEPSSSASAAAAQPSHPHQARDGVDDPPAPLTAAEVAEWRKKNRQNFNKRRGELLDDLLRNIDILVYAELSTIYYMDCYFLRFIGRAFVQFLFLTPKPAMFPEAPANRPYVGAIFGSNIFCIVMHIFGNAPSAGEATRGYLHGGLAMDFIGQKGPSSIIHLLLLDLLVLVLQLLHLSAHIVRQKLKESLAIPITTATGSQYSAPPVSTNQDLEAEERGVRRSAEQQEREDIEMQTLNPAGEAATPSANADRPEPSEREALIASSTLPSRTDAHIFDAFNSGQIVLADLDIWSTVKEQFWAYQKAPPDARTVETNRAMRERFAARVLRWRFDAPAIRGRTIG